jgi:hypothetical protein
MTGYAKSDTKIGNTPLVGNESQLVNMGWLCLETTEKFRDLSLRQFKMVSVYVVLDIRSRKIVLRNRKDLNSTLHVGHGNALRKNTKEE